jgi:lipopolysaccharide transport system permease protein
MPSAPDDVLPAGATVEWWEIEPKQQGLVHSVRELWHYRYLWWYFASAAITAMYRRTKLGWLWLVLRVMAPVGVTALLFGGILGLGGGGTPYFLFLVCGTTTWVLFERSLLTVTRSLEQNRKLITKVYFPRLILPLSAVAPGLLYLVVLLLALVGTVVYHYNKERIWYVTLRPELLVSAGAILLTLVFTVAVGLWTSVLQTRYRDIRQGLRYFMPFWYYFTPVLYPASVIPENWRWLVVINPMAFVGEAFKWGTLGQGHITPASTATALSLIALTLVSGLWFFNRAEADSIDKL